MEDYLYILLGVAWVAYSLYSARQKALRKQQSSGLPPREPSQSSPLPIPGGGQGKSILDDLLRELTGETSTPKREINPDAYPQPVLIKESQGSDPDLRGFSNYKFLSTDEQAPAKIESEDRHKTHSFHGQLAKNEELKRNFNLREAVIYSELLNRKYF